MSKQRNLRKARLSFADDEEDDAGEQGSVALPPAAVKAAQQQKQKEKRAEKKMSLLSFDDGGDGDEEEGAAVKRSGSKGRSRGLRIPAAAGIPPSRATTYTQVAAAGEYTAEKLKDLQRATQRAPRTGGGSSGAGASAAGAPAMPLPPPPLPTGVEDVDMLEDQEYVGAAAIPDAAAIKAAKAKRERLRSAHDAPDYIALGGGGGGAEDDAYGVAARIRDVRERRARQEADAAAAAAAARGSDEEEEADEVMRVRFGAGEAKRGGREAAVMAVGASGEEDEEEAAWAEEQIRKGVRSGGGKAGAQDEAKAAAPRPPSGVGFLPPSQAAAVAAAADEAVEALRAAVQRAQLSQKQAEKNLGRTERSLEDCLAGIQRAEDELKASGDKYVYVQQLRAYVADLCAMLAEKSPLVEELQDELQRAREERTAAHFRRCADAERAARAPAEAAVAAALGALTAGQGESAARAAAAAAAEAADQEVASGAHIPVQLDEFGRDSNASRRAKLADRVARRAAQEAAKDAAAAAAASDDGGATTSESEDEVEDYRRRRGEVLEAAESAFKDADDEFGSLAAVKSRLEGWKATYPGQYADAYMSDSVPALFAPFVRRELLAWSPLDDATAAASAPQQANGSTNAGPPQYRGFDAQEWHRLLFDYGMPANGGAPAPDDPDGDLIPRLVKALVVPAVSAALERVWNPFSTRQSAAVAAMLGEVAVYFDPGSDATAGLTAAALRRLEQASAAVNVPSWPPAVLTAVPRAARYQERAFRRGLRVLRSVAAFQEVIPPAALQALAVHGLAAGKLLPHVRAAAADPLELARRASLLLGALSAEWLSAGPPRGLEGLGDVVAAAVRALEPAAGSDERREAAAPAAAALAGVMAQLGDAAGAQRLKLMFGVA